MKGHLAVAGVCGCALKRAAVLWALVAGYVPRKLCLRTILQSILSQNEKSASLASVVVSIAVVAPVRNGHKVVLRTQTGSTKESDPFRSERDSDEDGHEVCCLCVFVWW